MLINVKMLFFVGCLLLSAVMTCDHRMDAAPALPASEAVYEETETSVIEETLKESSSAIVFFTTVEESFSESSETKPEMTETVFLDPETEEETFMIDSSDQGPNGYFSIPDLQIGVPLYSVYDNRMDQSGAAALSRGKMVLDHVEQDNFSLLEQATEGMRAYLCRSDGSVLVLVCTCSQEGVFDGENYCMADGTPIKKRSEYAAVTCHNWPGIWVTLWKTEKV